MDLYIKGKKFTHHVNVINNLNDNMTGIDSQHIHKLHFDVRSHQFKISGMDFNQIVANK